MRTGGAHVQVGELGPVTLEVDVEALGQVLRDRVDRAGSGSLLLKLRNAGFAGVLGLESCVTSPAAPASQ